MHHISKNTLVFLATLIVATIIIVAYLAYTELQIEPESFVTEQRDKSPILYEESTTTVHTMIEPEVEPGWSLFDSVASGEINAVYHFAFEHPTDWYKDISCSDSWCSTIIADYDVHQIVPDENDPGVGTTYEPDHYCRVLVKIGSGLTAPQVSYENTHIDPDKVFVCDQALRRTDTTFWFDFSAAM